MKLLRAQGGAIALALALLSVSAVAMAAPTCNTTTPACGPVPPGVACKGAVCNIVFISNPNFATCGTGTPIGGFDFSATEFANTCTRASSCPNAIVPPERWWWYDNYATANSGCVDMKTMEALVNNNLDLGLGNPGQWILYQGNWLSGALGDGCIGSPPGPELRTVVEFSFADTPSENSVNHKSWYLIAAVDNVGDYNFDRIKGGAGCAPGVLAPQNVGGLTIVGHSGGCVNNPTPTNGSVNGNPGFFDVQVNLPVPSPDFYDEVGKSNLAKPLISGYQIMYAGGTTTDSTSEPKTSNAAGVWQPALDPTNPTNIAAVIPYGNTTATTVALPVATGNWFWLATRIVYKDASMNPTGTVAPGAGPLVVSDVSSHCGPVKFSTVAVQFKSVTAERNNAGVRVSWQTMSEDDTLGFQVVRMSGPAGHESIEVLPTQVESHGAFYPYEILDYGVASDMATTYTYYVQEITTSGSLGDRSELVTVPGQVAPTSNSGGGRNRGGRARR